MLAEVHPFTVGQAGVVEGAAWLNMTLLVGADSKLSHRAD